MDSIAKLLAELIKLMQKSRIGKGKARSSKANSDRGFDGRRSAYDTPGESFFIMQITGRNNAGKKLKILSAHISEEQSVETR